MLSFLAKKIILIHHSFVTVAAVLDAPRNAGSADRADALQGLPTTATYLKVRRYDGLAVGAFLEGEHGCGFQ